MLTFYQTEMQALETVSADSNKLLSEKLALTRELSTLKPELEHLRAQVAGHENLLSEKLKLQRQLSAVEVELENEKRAVKKMQAKSRKSSILQQPVNEDLEEQMDELRTKLKEERVSNKEAKKDVDRLKRELEKAKEATASAKEGKDAATVDSAQVEEMRKELAKEKREREAAERGVQKVQNEAEAKSSMLNDKLSAFRTKLKSTKEKLKETETELQKAQDVAANATTTATAATKSKNPRKRTADPDATIGTPGDAQPAKRGKRATAGVGEKSSFSITPFLNRTGSVAPTSPIAEDDEDEESATPSVAAKKSKKATEKTNPLAPAPSKANVKTAAKTKKPVLEAVAEEETSPFRDDTLKPTAAAKSIEPEQPSPKPSKMTKSTTTTTKLALGAPVPKLKPADPNKKKPRKSLHEFATFNIEQNAEPQKQQKKKRKLLGQGFGKTLFDEDDEGEELKVKPIPGRMFAGRAFASMKGKPKGDVSLITTGDGFQFSPLKKERRAGSVRDRSILV